jgi:hypothetical protein
VEYGEFIRHVMLFCVLAYFFRCFGQLSAGALAGFQRVFWRTIVRLLFRLQCSGQQYRCSLRSGQTPSSALPKAGTREYCR